MSDSVTRVHEAFLRRVADGDLPQVGAGATALALWPLFRAQVASRHLDRMARQLQAQGRGYYTIGSSGHEGMAGVAAALRVSDPALLHYRDAAFQIMRAGQVDGVDAMRDMLLSFTAAKADPISGGRHKVLGSKRLNIPPQTSTIASHLPKAVGMAWGLARAGRDDLVLCSFGDASLNHSTAQGALNCAGWTAWQGAPLPLMLVCEDNGIGISVKSPPGWVAARLSAAPGLRYERADGCDAVAVQAAAADLADWIRRTRKPGVLHLDLVRLYGHAGADVEAAYLGPAEIAAQEARDPLLVTAAHLRAAGATPGEILEEYRGLWARCESIAEEVLAEPALEDAAAVMASLIPPKPRLLRRHTPSPDAVDAVFGADQTALDSPQPMGKLINLVLAEQMLHHPEIVMAGQDIGAKGGVYGITKGLRAKFGRTRVVDTILDEQSILGLAQGLAQTGHVAMPEIQFLAYLHNAEDQLRGEAATVPFFSNGQFATPMVVRIAGLGYQRGFGGHFHNDNSLAVLRDIPGLIIGCPSDGLEAVLMYREAVRLAREENRVVVMVEPIARYGTRDLLDEDDGGWMRYFPTSGTAALGTFSRHGVGRDLCIVTYGNGVFLSRQAQAELGQGVSVLDLRWLAPLDGDALLAATEQDTAVLIVDECRRTGSQSEALMTLFAEGGRTRVARVTAEDSFIATGPAFAATLPSCAGIVAAARALLT